MKKIESSKMWKIHQTTIFFIAAYKKKTWFFNGFWLKMICDTPKNHEFFMFSSIQAKNEKNHHFRNVQFLQFWVHLDPILSKISRFHAPQQEKLVTKVILLSLSWTCLICNQNMNYGQMYIYLSCSVSQNLVSCFPMFISL